MSNQSEKAHSFRALHEETFVIANAWDAGSARILTALGFKALATSSGASAGVLGRLDGKVTREEALAHCKAIVDATDLPVSADLEKGFGDTPQAAAETIRLAAGIGLVGASIEDATGDPAKPLFESSHARDRIAAAVEAARSLPFPFTLTARTENYLRGNPDLDDTIRRLRFIRGRGSRRVDGARSAGPGIRARRLRRAVSAGQLHGRNQGKIVHRGRALRGWGEARQPGDVVVSRRDDRLGERGERGRRARNLRLSGGHARDTRDECIHERMSRRVSLSRGG